MEDNVKKGKFVRILLSTLAFWSLMWVCSLIASSFGSSSSPNILTISLATGLSGVIILFLVLWIVDVGRIMRGKSSYFDGKE